MRVLVTRAAEDAARTHEKLAAAGHEVVVSPVIEIVGTGAAWPAGVTDAVVATSAHAFGMLEAGPSVEAARLMPLFLVGERTETRARACGFAGAVTVAANAAALVLRLGTLRNPAARLVYLAGRDRKPEIETTLEASGRTFVLVEVYEARPAAFFTDEAADAIRAGAIDAVLHFSRRSASLFDGLANVQGLDATRLRHLCLSNDVAEPLRQSGLPRVELAEAPNEAALLALLDQA